MNWKLIPAVLVAGLTACAADPQGPARSADTQAPQSPSQASADTGAGTDCDAQSIQNMVGQSYSERTAEDARQRSGSASLRVLRPGEVMTMEYDPRRLNVILDAGGAIEALRCG
ncbi:I78 family peptidase inhibitor [Bordetella sp. 2513F-2]